MKPLGMHNYYVYILTNIKRSILYTGVTNDLYQRLIEHADDSKTGKKHFAGKYNCIYLIYYERFEWIHHAIETEKQIKGWTRSKKNELIDSFNKDWEFLNHHFDDY